MWVVANFVDENNVEVVPHSWVKGEECFWPTLPRDKLRRCIEKQIQPDESGVWKKYKVRVIGTKIYDDLQKAREKCNVAIFKSDIETDEEKKRRRIKNKKYFAESNSSSSSDSDNAIQTSDSDKEDGPPPSKKIKKTLWPSTKKGQHTKLVSPLKEPEDLPDVPELPRRSPRKLTPRKVPSPVPGSSKTNPATFSSQGSSSKTGSFETICIRNQNIMKNLLREMLGELGSINEKLDQSRRGGTNEEVDESSNLINHLPLKTEEELNNLEEILQDKTKETELTNYLSRGGGKSMGDACRRALRTALLDEVACLFSWAGQKGKRPFNTLQLRSVISRAVLKQFPTSTDKEIESVVKDWLKPSKNRLLSKEKSKKRGKNEEGTS